MSKVRFLGLDVHADTIAAAIAEPNGEVRPLGYDPESPGVDPEAGEQTTAGPAAFGPATRQARPVTCCIGN